MLAVRSTFTGIVDALTLTLSLTLSEFSMRSFLKQTSLWRFLRGIKRGMLPPAGKVISAEHRIGKLEWLNPPAAVEARQTIEVQLRVLNDSPIAWLGTAAAPLTVRCQWLTRHGKPFDQDPTSLGISSPLFPAEPQEFRLSLPTPDVVGDFILQVDIVQEGQSWFQDKAVRTPLTVIGSRATDIDYHSVYRQANLQENHWWVVGAYHSKEEYDRSMQQRLDMLKDHGLTPDSWLLDIGCGTGQMAQVFRQFASSKGGYSGCDIGREAIDFCKKEFPIPNFHFTQSEMTRVPFETNSTHDMAIFFSVFTHTFTDETALLLSEAKRLLKPTGVIIADVITSDLVERGAGHRGEMTVNRHHFERLAAMLGYDSSVIGKWPWNRHSERIMYILRPHSCASC
jgi:SAM-dependent methyltransferase